MEIIPWSILKKRLLEPEYCNTIAQTDQLIELHNYIYANAKKFHYYNLFVLNSYVPDRYFTNIMKLIITVINNYPDDKLVGLYTLIGRILDSNIDSDKLLWAIINKNSLTLTRALKIPEYVYRIKEFDKLLSYQNVAPVILDYLFELKNTSLIKKILKNLNSFHINVIEYLKLIYHIPFSHFLDNLLHPYLPFSYNSEKTVKLIMKYCYNYKIVYNNNHCTVTLHNKIYHYYISKNIYLSYSLAYYQILENRNDMDIMDVIERKMFIMNYYNYPNLYNEYIENITY